MRILAKLTIIACVVALLTGNMAVAGTISGVVKDADTQKPLPGNDWGGSTRTWVLLARWDAKYEIWDQLYIYPEPNPDNGYEWYWEQYDPDSKGEVQIKNYWIRHYNAFGQDSFTPASLRSGRYLLEIRADEYLLQRREFIFNPTTDTNFGDILLEKNPVDLSSPTEGIATIQGCQLKLKYFVTNLTDKEIFVGASSLIISATTSKLVYDFDDNLYKFHHPEIFATIQIPPRWLVLGPYESRIVEESFDVQELPRGQRIYTRTTIVAGQKLFAVLRQKDDSVKKN